MKKWWTTVSARVDAMSRRERLMILGTLLVLSIFVLYTLLIEPLSLKKRMAVDMIQENTQQLAMLQQDIATLRKTSKVDPHAELKSRLQAVKKRLESVDNRLEAIQERMVNPEKMPQLLESLLRKHAQLRLVSLHTLPVSDLMEMLREAEGSSGTPREALLHDEIRIFRHGAEITVEGNYLDLLDYVTALEGLQWKLIWGQLALSAERPGPAMLTFTVYTLSTDKTWLSI